MQKAATTPELKAAIEEHVAQTKEQVVRLEEVLLWRLKRYTRYGFFTEIGII